VEFFDSCGGHILNIHKSGQKFTKVFEPIYPSINCLWEMELLTSSITSAGHYSRVECVVACHYCFHIPWWIIMQTIAKEQEIWCMLYPFPQDLVLWFVSRNYSICLWSNWNKLINKDFKTRRQEMYIFLYVLGFYFFWNK
jgi:hypothetical protein